MVPSEIEKVLIPIPPDFSATAADLQNLDKHIQTRSGVR